MPKRIANYRSGDRAELLGVVLMQAYCAVASIPRQEDFGLVDAVATLLRRDGRLLFAEDSFLLQFKSRSEKTIEYFGDRYRALLKQELALFIASVDMPNAEIKLYSVGAALSHPNALHAKGLVLELDCSDGGALDGDTLRIRQSQPALRWSTAQLGDRDFAEAAYEVMKVWLDFDRWNRRYRTAGMLRQICWQTNKTPTSGGTVHLYNPATSAEATSELIPAVQAMMFRAVNDTTLGRPILDIVAWMRREGADPDPTGDHSFMVMCHMVNERIRSQLLLAEAASFGVGIIVNRALPQHIDFWLVTADRKASSASRYSGSKEELRALGFIFDFSESAPPTFSLDTPWLSNQRATVASVAGDVILLCTDLATGTDISKVSI
jgi:hypothetical protein